MKGFITVPVVTFDNKPGVVSVTPTVGIALSSIRATTHYFIAQGACPLHKKANTAAT